MPIKLWNKVTLFGVLWLAVMASSFWVVINSHHSRQLYAEYVDLQREEHRLRVESGKYLLEQSAWAEFGRIEKLAVEELEMRVPGLDEIVLVNP